MNESHLNSSLTSPKKIIQLFLKPKQFFSDFRNLNTSHIYIFTYIVAMFMVMDRIDSRLIKVIELGDGDIGKMGFLTQSWISYWGIVAIVAIFSSFIIWFVYGWWYEIRLKWSGVKGESSDLIRTVNMMQWSIIAIPTLILTIIYTFIYENYLDAFLAGELWSPIILLFFTLYSCWVSYIAVKTVFNANKYALFWFLILPLLIYSSLIIALTSLLAST